MTLKNRANISTNGYCKKKDISEKKIDKKTPSNR